MSKTDKTRPWWVRMGEMPMVTCVPVHDHRQGPCTLPDEITPQSADRGRRPSGCHWRATDRFLFEGGGWAGDGSREWNFFRRAERRRSRHQARRALRALRDRR
jgi:hypothetical protein